MSSETLSDTVEAGMHDADHHDADHHHHPSDRKYVGIAIGLAIITAVEVLTFYVDFGPLFIPSLLLMMFVKFYYVCGWFMHLKLDSPMFTKFFVAGLVLAAGVYVVMLSASQLWDNI